MLRAQTPTPPRLLDSVERDSDWRPSVSAAPYDSRIERLPSCDAPGATSDDRPAASWVDTSIRLASFAAADPTDTDSDEWKPAADLRPNFLRLPDDSAIELEPPLGAPSETLWLGSFNAPLGYTGPSSVLPSEAQVTSHFIPIEDRWRAGFPEWDRYDKGHPGQDDYPFAEGRLIDPYNQNVLKGDYPIIGQHTFLNITATSDAILEYRQVPTPTTPFESTQDPEQMDFFGNPDQFFYAHYFKLSAELNHGDAAFKPADWRIKATPIFNVNYLDVNELAVVSPNVANGTTRGRTFTALEEWFVETKLADLSPDYDFLSLKAGSQFFTSDFRGFIFSDTNRAIRLFGTRLSNRDQFNLIYFDQTEKDTNSLLNTFRDRRQNTLIANYYRQDCIWPGYTAQASVHYNRDQADFIFDENGFLARPDPVGVFQPHQVDSVYLGWAGDGHINRFNITHAFYWALGHDSLNPLAGRPVSINAQMAAVELSYDRDWIRFRTSFFYASGDHDVNDGEGRGFDTIFDNPQFAGGEFSYWQRQTIKLLGVNLKQRMSLVPDLRSSKFEGQTNFVNPGLELFNLGMDFDLTPKMKLITNANYLWFDDTNVLEQYVFQSNIRRTIGADLSMGIEYRPLLNNNIIFVGGISGLIAGNGFQDLYSPIVGGVNNVFASFVQLTMTY